ncbi:spore germination protein [Alicyclobacillus suci]|uniref:spore germination protein n=1 Tax=Alicyclobacillus suci TaxID=2816080 RepID=UPI002E2BF6AB|nr:spore germination protein [Alicyclobacillus suci]
MFRKSQKTNHNWNARLNHLERKRNVPANIPNDVLQRNVDANEQLLRNVFDKCSDVVFHSIKVKGRTDIVVVYIDGLIDIQNFEDMVLKPILYEGPPQGLGRTKRIGQLIEDNLIAIVGSKTVSRTDELIHEILDANLALLIDGERESLILHLKNVPTRAIQEPKTEPGIRGPQEGFTESIRTNTAMLRKIIKSADLKFESVVVGELSRTDVLIIYLSRLVNTSVLNEVRSRVQRIQIDAIVDSAYIEELIEDAPFSPFPMVQNTERPDVVIANLLEGKVAILVDGSPFVLIAPQTFWGALQAAEDYYDRFIYVSFIRILRFGLLWISLLLPSIYVALTTFHPQLMPTNLLLSFVAARELSPFPAVVEALLMEVMFEALREAGIRLPRAVGSAVSIVGALVIGQAAVQAGIISAPMVIVVSTTGIASFALPRYQFGTSFRLLRFPMLLLAGTLGFYGIALGLMAMMTHLVTLRSFGIPYWGSLQFSVFGNLKDTIFRFPIWMRNKRPNILMEEDSTRIPVGQKPSPKR